MNWRIQKCWAFPLLTAVIAGATHAAANAVPAGAQPTVERAADARIKGGPGFLPFSSEPQLAIPDGTYIGIDDGNDGFGEDAGMACDTINTAGHVGQEVFNLFVAVRMSHEWIGDLVMKLRSPSGDILTLLNRPGFDETVDDGQEPGHGDSSNLSDTAWIIFQDGSFFSAEDMGATLNSSQFVCLDDNECAFTPVPGAGVGTDLFQFVQTEAEGAWTLCVGDHTEFDPGVLTAWELGLTSLGQASTAGPPLNIPDGDYIGIGDGNDGFGPDAGMACGSLSTMGKTGTWVTPTSLGVAMDSTYVGDLVLKLQAPGGQIVGLMSRPGWLEPLDDGSGTGGDASNLSGFHEVYFADFASTSAEDMGAGFNGVVCADDPTCVFAPDPGSTTGLPGLGDVPLDAGDGTWTLCIGDSVLSDPATLRNARLNWITVGRHPDLLFADGFEAGDLRFWSSGPP